MDNNKISESYFDIHIAEVISEIDKNKEIKTKDKYIGDIKIGKIKFFNLDENGTYMCKDPNFCLGTGTKTEPGIYLVKITDITSTINGQRCKGEILEDNPINKLPQHF